MGFWLVLLEVGMAYGLVGSVTKGDVGKGWLTITGLASNH